MKQKMWMVRAGRNAKYVEDFLEKDCVAIGWNKVGKISDVEDREEMKELVRENKDYQKKSQVRMAASQLFRFAKKVKKEDYVLTYDNKNRVYHLGKIKEDLEYNTSLLDYHHLRRVKWLGKIDRDKLSTSTKNTLGAISTLFKVSKESAQEILSIHKGKESTEVEEEEEELEDIKEDIQSRSYEFVKDKILELEWDEVEELVAGVMRGMEYKTRMTDSGSDRGRDIEASPDGLGFEDPRVIIEVKHRNKSIGAKEIRSLKGALSKGKNGLYVSTGGFTKDARYEAERATPNLKLIDLDELVELIFTYYDNFDSKTRDILPLSKIYWPKS